MQIFVPMALFLIFLVLRLTGVIAWSYWFITAPLWIPALLILVYVLYLARNLTYL